MASHQVSTSSLNPLILPKLTQIDANANNEQKLVSIGSLSRLDGENYWFLDFQNTIMNMNKLTNISFMSSISYPEKINNVLRICILLGILLSLVLRNYNWLWLPIIIGFATYVLYLFRVKNVNKEIQKLGSTANITSLPENVKTKFEEFIDMNKYVKPTIENPFMNALNFDPRDRKPACNVDNTEKTREIEQLFNTGLYRSASDIFNKNNSQREFYVMPCTTFPNDQSGFAKWLYGTPPTCKEGNGDQCIANVMDTIGRRLETPRYVA